MEGTPRARNGTSGRKSRRQGNPRRATHCPSGDASLGPGRGPNHSIAAIWHSIRCATVRERIPRECPSATTGRTNTQQ